MHIPVDHINFKSPRGIFTFSPFLSKPFHLSKLPSFSCRELVLPLCWSRIRGRPGRYDDGDDGDDGDDSRPGFADDEMLHGGSC